MVVDDGRSGYGPDGHHGRVNQTGFTGEQKAWKVSHEQGKIKEPFFNGSEGARGAFGSGE